MGVSGAYALWLACKTQDEIAEAVGVPRDTINGWVNGFVEISDTDKSTKLTTFTPPLYNIWNKQKKTNETNHFGQAEQRSVLLATVA